MICLLVDWINGLIDYYMTHNHMTVFAPAAWCRFLPINILSHIFMCNSVLRQCFILSEWCITLCLLESGNIADDSQITGTCWMSMFPRFSWIPQRLLAQGQSFCPWQTWFPEWGFSVLKEFLRKEERLSCFWCSKLIAQGNRGLCCHRRKQERRGAGERNSESKLLLLVCPVGYTCSLMQEVMYYMTL